MYDLILCQPSNITLWLTIYRKEDLGMYGNELNYMQTCWTVGYVIGEIPSNILLTRIKPRYWIPAMEVSCTPYLLRPSTYRSASLDCSYNVLVSMQHPDSILRAEVFCWYVNIAR